MNFEIFLICSLLVHKILAEDDYYDEYAAYYDSLGLSEARDCSIYKDYDFR